MGELLPTKPIRTPSARFDPLECVGLQLDIPALAVRATLALKVQCLHIDELPRGASHQIFALQFDEGKITSTVPGSLVQAGLSCIARFPLAPGDVARYSSEVATMKYLKRYTSIPVPEIYDYDLDPDNDVGAPFLLMERLPSNNLDTIWDRWSYEYKKMALSQIATVVVQLASLKFDQIGCLKKGQSGSNVGPLIHPCLAELTGPFESTAEFIQSFLSPDSIESLKLRDLYRKIQGLMDRIFAVFGRASFLHPPFCLLHPDFDGQNMLFDISDSGPILTGLIDFEYAHTGPLYFLYDHPIFIRDSYSEPLGSENVLLRAHFVRAVYDGLPDPKARATFIACMNAKTFALVAFRDLFMVIKCSENALIKTATRYLVDFYSGIRLAPTGGMDYYLEKYDANGNSLTLINGPEFDDAGDAPG